MLDRLLHMNRPTHFWLYIRACTMDPECGGNYALLTFQNDGGGFLKIEDDGSLKLQCSPIEDIKSCKLMNYCGQYY